MKKIIGIVFLSIILLQACKKETKKVETKSEDKVNLADIQIHKDSANVAWKRMMANDDQKFKNMLALLDNISFISGSNEKVIKQVKTEIETLWKSRYDSTQMTAANVDGFDQKTSELISKITDIAQKTPGIEKYANCSNLQQEISNADNNTLLLDRAHYDKWAKEYNNLISKENKDNKSKSLPLFETLN